MPRVLRRPLAEADILEIWDYIAEDSLPAADRWLDRLDEQFRLLATHPMIGRSLDELAPGVRIGINDGNSGSTAAIPEATGACRPECVVGWVYG